jgi:hypothetical protein
MDHKEDVDRLLSSHESAGSFHSDYFWLSLGLLDYLALRVLYRTQTRGFRRAEMLADPADYLITAARMLEKKLPWVAEGWPARLAGWHLRRRIGAMREEAFALLRANVDLVGFIPKSKE